MVLSEECGADGFFGRRGVTRGGSSPGHDVTRGGGSPRHDVTREGSPRQGT